MTMFWDPLMSLSESNREELVFSAKKREINNILKSYVGFYDPFCELIQNAMDAVDDRRKLNERGYKKRIWISINMKENTLSVSDNGIGFTEEQLKLFLCPNVSFKDGKGSRGRKGVGATYLGYGFNFLQVGTKSPGYEVVTEIQNGRNWVESIAENSSRPLLKSSSLIHAPFKQIDRGSTFTIKFHGENVRPKDLSWIGANNAEQWKHVLLIKTPLGHLSIDNHETEEILFDLEVINKEDEITALKNQKASYIFPHLVINTSVDLKEITNEQKRLNDIHLDGAKANDKYKKLNGIYYTLTTEEIIEILGFKGDEAVLIKQFNIHAYAYFCYSTQVWDSLNDNTMKLRKGTRILRGGLQLATNNMPQGELITIPLTSSIGYQNQTHVVVHFDNADPDLGRKGFQPELQEVAKNIGSSIVNKLKKWRGHLKDDTGTIPTILSQGKLDEWIDQQKDHERSQPLSLINSNFFAPVNEVSVTSKPLSEQDVIVLFSQLLAGGVIRGIKVMATSQHQQYDGVFRYVVKPPLENHLFEKSKNPLGVQAIPGDGDGFTSKPYVLEYKYNLDGLISDFENEVKNEKDITLVVCWEIGEEYKRRYTVQSLLDLDNLHHRELHGITHVFKDEKTGDVRFNAIVLKDLIDYLNDVDSVQDYHKTKFQLAEQL